MSHSPAHWPGPGAGGEFPPDELEVVLGAGELSLSLSKPLLGLQPVPGGLAWGGRALTACPGASAGLTDQFITREAGVVLPLLPGWGAHMTRGATLATVPVMATAAAPFPEEESI